MSLHHGLIFLEHRHDHVATTSKSLVALVVDLFKISQSRLELAGFFADSKRVVPNLSRQSAQQVTGPGVAMNRLEVSVWRKGAINLVTGR